MLDKPVNDAPRTEAESSPAPQADSALYRVMCTHAIDGTFAGWLDYSGPGNWAYLSGAPNAPGGMTFEDYYNKGNRYLNPVGTYVGNPRYLGANGNPGDCQAAWNYWVRATKILWDGDGLIRMTDVPAQHLIDFGNGWVYWGTNKDTALKCQRVAV